MMFSLIIANIVFRAALTALMAYILIAFGHSLTRMERFGMGITGGSSFLTIALIADVRKIGTPFDGWSPSLLTLGVIVFVTGRLLRFRKHQRNNAAAVEAAAQHLKGRQ